MLAAQLFNLQIIKHNFYETKAIDQQVRETTVSAARGTIYDANMKILAMSASVDDIIINPSAIKKNGEDAELIARTLSEILGHTNVAFIMQRYVHSDTATKWRGMEAMANLI